MIPLSHYLIVSTIVFIISLVGIVLHRSNIIILLLCIELMLLAINFNFLAFAHYLRAAAGEIFVFFILTVAAAETAIGLAILILFFRIRGAVNVNDLNLLKG